MSKQPYLNSNAINRSFWLCCSVVVVYTFWVSLTPLQAAQSQFRMQAATIAVAAGKSQNSNFALNSCIDQFMAATSSSTNFRLQSGCGAMHSTRAAGEDDPTLIEEAIPILSLWSMTLLALLILLASSLYLRAEKPPSL